jgi:hypothetical protein
MSPGNPEQDVNQGFLRQPHDAYDCSGESANDPEHCTIAVDESAQCGDSAMQ